MKTPIINILLIPAIVFCIMSGANAQNIRNRDHSMRGLLGQDTTLCAGDTLLLNIGVDIAIQRWQDGSTGSAIAVTEPGIYWVDVVGVDGNYRDSIVVQFDRLPEVDLGNDTIICSEAELVLDATTVDATYVWQDGSDAARFKVSEAGIYTVEVSKGACKNVDSIRIKEQIWPCEGGVPTGCGISSAANFSPGNGGVNHQFSVNSTCGYKSYNLRIFNRWGRVVFETRDPRKGWTGQHATQGVYRWELEYTLNMVKARAQRKKGEVFLSK